MSEEKKQPYSFFSPVYLTVTLAGIGKSPIAPGTLGSLVAALEFTGYIKGVGLTGLTTYFAHVIFITLIGFYCVHSYCKNTGKKDPKEVIIDEYVGQYIAQLTSYAYCINFIEGFKHTYLLILLSFIFYRIYDIVKPSLVGYCDKNLKGAAGVMLDDVVAGIFSSISVIIFFTLIYTVINASA